MTNQVAIERLPTRIPGLDEVLGGGIPELSFNIIAGPPGCGKTTLSHQMMFAWASPQRPALYFTVLGEPPLKMLRYQQLYDFFDSSAINRSIFFFNLADEAASGNLELVLQRITDEVEAHKPGFIFVDSFRSIMAATDVADGPHPSLQQFVQRLGALLTSWQATTFLIGEYADVADANPVFTVADGLLWLRQSVQRNSMVRKLEVMKMRGQATRPGLHSYRIGKAGLEVFAYSDLSETQAPEQAPDMRRLSLGVAGLDDMLGGGLPCGYSLLVAGPSGSGKSILAAAFLAEGARCGEAGVIAAFEQDPRKSRNRQLVDLIHSGKIGMIHSPPGNLSIDEVLVQLMREVQRLHASRVVIDSLSGLELALAPTYQEDFRESLLRLVTTLTNAGITVLMTSELEDRYGDLRFSPYGAAFLTDVIIVQRYVEVDSRLQRMMAVVKVRASAHSDALHAFTIDDNGLRVGEVMREQEGLLSGRPTRRHGAAD
jgi:circadian clock protein KaiC